MKAFRLADRRVYGALILALCCQTASAASGTAGPGRLFLTPQQRQNLEHKRMDNRVEKKKLPVRKGAISVEGKVQRSSGRNAAWINDTLQFDSDTGADAERVTVEPYAGAPSVSLKVGQTYERASGAVRDGLEGGKITLRKSARPARPAAAR